MLLATEWPLTRASVRRRHNEEVPLTCEEEDVDGRVFAALQDLKSRVPSVVDRVGRAAWYARIDPTGRQGASGNGVSRNPVVASRAFHKMGEIFQSCALPYPSCSLHLCEAPGGFVQWLGGNHRFVDAWRWRAISLATGPAFRTDVLRMDRGEVLLRDVTDDGWVTQDLIPASFDLVTADGASAMDHDHIEEAHLGLLWAQANVAMRALAVGGTFVVKFFEGGLRGTRLFIAQMTTAFRQVSIIKPVSSRATNSERYLVCRHFQTAVARDDDLVLSREWNQEVASVLGRMASKQSQELRRILAAF